MMKESIDLMLIKYIYSIFSKRNTGLLNDTVKGF